MNPTGCVEHEKWSWWSVTTWRTSRKAESFGRDSWQHIFPPCHTYSVAVTSSAIKGSSTNNATLFMITTHLYTEKKPTAWRLHTSRITSLQVWQKHCERMQAPVAIMFWVMTRKNYSHDFLDSRQAPKSCRPVSHSNISLQTTVSWEQVMSHS